MLKEPLDREERPNCETVKNAKRKFERQSGIRISLMRSRDRKIEEIMECATKRLKERNAIGIK